MPFKIFLLLALIFPSSFAYSQLNLPQYSLSFKGGYHSSSEQYSNEYFRNGFILDASGEVRLGRVFYLGVNYQYFINTNSNYTRFQETYSREYKNEAVNIYFKVRGPLGPINIYGGLGMGNFRMETSSKYGHQNDNYLELRFTTGADYLLTDNLAIACEVSVSNLLTTQVNINYYSIKAGPVYVF